MRGSLKPHRFPTVSPYFGFQAALPQPHHLNLFQTASEKPLADGLKPQRNVGHIKTVIGRAAAAVEQACVFQSARGSLGRGGGRIHQLHIGCFLPQQRLEQRECVQPKTSVSIFSAKSGFRYSRAVSRATSLSSQPSSASETSSGQACDTVRACGSAPLMARA